MSDTVEVVVKVTDQASSALSGIGSKLQAVGGIALGAVAVGLGAAAGGIMALANASIQGNAQFEQYNTQFGVLLGSAEAAQQRMAELAEFGATTPFELPQVVEADKILQGFGLHSVEAAEKFGYAGEEIRTIAGDVASGTGASFEEMALLIGKFSAGATGEAISRMQEMGITTRDELAQMGLEFSKSGELLSPLPESMEVVLGLMQDKYGGMMDAQSTTFNGMLSNLQDWKDATIRRLGEPIFEVAKEQLGSLLAFINSPATMAAIEEFANALATGISDFITWIMDVGIPGFMTFVGNVQELGARIMEFLDPILAVVAGFVSWQDVLTVLGIAIASVILPIIYSIITTLLPLVAIVVGLVAVVSLLRNAWENDWGGIRTALVEFWEQTAQPALTQLWEWLSVNVPIAIASLQAAWEAAWPLISNALQIAWEIIGFFLRAMWDSLVNVIIPSIVALYSYWVEVAWPAISAALINAWTIIQPILMQIKDFILNVVIPTVQDLYIKWTTVWWPTIQTVLANTWTAIRAIFEELGRWVNDNIVPWIEYLSTQWANVWWPAISAAVQAAWEAIEPLLTTAREWLEVNIPTALESLQSAWRSIWGALSPMIDPVREAIDGIANAVRSFWEFISSHTFDFQINIPDLPDWAIPGSPLPIHTAWEDFNNYMGSAAFNVGNPQGQTSTSNKSIVMNTNVYTSSVDLREAGEMGAKFAYGGI